VCELLSFVFVFTASLPLISTHKLVVEKFAIGASTHAIGTQITDAKYCSSAVCSPLGTQRRQRRRPGPTPRHVGCAAALGAPRLCVARGLPLPSHYRPADGRSAGGPASCSCARLHLALYVAGGSQCRPWVGRAAGADAPSPKCLGTISSIR